MATAFIYGVEAHDHRRALPKEKNDSAAIGHRDSLYVIWAYRQCLQVKDFQFLATLPMLILF